MWFVINHIFQNKTKNDIHLQLDLRQYTTPMKLIIKNVEQIKALIIWLGAEDI